MGREEMGEFDLASWVEDEMRELEFTSSILESLKINLVNWGKRELELFFVIV